MINCEVSSLAFEFLQFTLSCLWRSKLLFTDESNFLSASRAYLTRWYCSLWGFLSMFSAGRPFFSGSCSFSRKVKLTSCICMKSIGLFYVIPTEYLLCPALIVHHALSKNILYRRRFRSSFRLWLSSKINAITQDERLEWGGSYNIFTFTFLGGTPEDVHVHI